MVNRVQNTKTYSGIFIAGLYKAVFVHVKMQWCSKCDNFILFFLLVSSENLLYNDCNMITLKQIFANDELYGWAMDVLTQSFPSCERRDDTVQLRAMSHPDYRLCAVMDGETPVGVVGYWDAPEFVYFENFCVVPNLRNGGYGTQTLTAITNGLNKPLILEVELPVDDITRRRIAFYKRNGMVENPYPHVQPHYRPTDPDLPLIILTYQKQISAQQYAALRAYLDANVEVR